MKRRVFIVGVGSVLAARASAAPPLVGILGPWSATDPVVGMLKRAMSEVGFTESKNIVVEWRLADGKIERLPTLARELVQLTPAAIVTAGDEGIRAVRRATTTIPIVAGSDDLVREGHVASLAKPGGNVTGVSILGGELNGKRLELLKEAVPSVSRVAVLWDPGTAGPAIEPLVALGRTLGVEVNVLKIRRFEDLDPAFETARAWRADGLNVLASPLLQALRGPIMERAARYRLPAIYQWEEFVREGGLMAYGPIFPDMLRQLFLQLDRVLKGARPADLPVAQPTRFGLAINLGTAKALGITIPASLLVRADQVVR